MIDLGSIAASTKKGEVYFPLGHLKEGLHRGSFFVTLKKRKWVPGKRNNEKAQEDEAMSHFLETGWLP